MATKPLRAFPSEQRREVATTRSKTCAGLGKLAALDYLRKVGAK